MAHAPDGAWSRPVGPAVRFESSPLVAKSGQRHQTGTNVIVLFWSKLLDLTCTVHVPTSGLQLALVEYRIDSQVTLVFQGPAETERCV